jgi:hypothetical protein
MVLYYQALFRTPICLSIVIQSFLASNQESKKLTPEMKAAIHAAASARVDE